MRPSVVGSLCWVLATFAAGVASPQTTSARPGVHPPSPAVAERGLASWYAEPYDGRQAASGEIYNKQDFTAAHRTLPFNTLVRVRRLDRNRSVVVRINDRGPSVASRIVDLSYAAAVVLGIAGRGVAPVALEIVGSASADPRNAFTIQLHSFRDAGFAAGFPWTSD